MAQIPSAYLKDSIQTLTPAQLVLALYDGALVAVGRAKEALGAGDRAGFETAHKELIRAQNIVLELKVCLDIERGGQIAASLDSLYSFCLDKLISANVAKDATLLKGVDQVIKGLRDAWAEACCGRVAQFPTQPAEMR